MLDDLGQENLVRKVYQQKDVSLLLGYIGWLVLESMSFVLIPKYFFRDWSGEERMKAFIAIANINFIISIVDIVLMVLVIILSKAKVVKVVFAVYLVCKLFLILSSLPTRTLSS